MRIYSALTAARYCTNLAKTWPKCSVSEYFSFLGLPFVWCLMEAMFMKIRVCCWLISFLVKSRSSEYVKLDHKFTFRMHKQKGERYKKISNWRLSFVMRQYTSLNVAEINKQHHTAYRWLTFQMNTFKIPHRTLFSRALFYFNLTVFAFGLQNNVLIYYSHLHCLFLRCNIHFGKRVQLSGHLYQMPIRNGFVLFLFSQLEICILKLNNGKEFAI